MLSPGVEGVVHGQLQLQLTLIIDLKQGEAVRDGKQAARLGRRVAVLGHVSSMDNLGKERDRRVVYLVLLDERLERALAVAMGVLGSRRVEAVGSLSGRILEDLVVRDVNDLRVDVDEFAYQPGTGDPIGLGVLTCDPLHGVAPFRTGPGKYGL